MFIYASVEYVLNRITLNPVHYRLISERGEELTLDQLNKDLKTLATQTKATKYREVMKVLRLALSGLQVVPLLTQTSESDLTVSSELLLQRD